MIAQAWSSTTAGGAVVNTPMTFGEWVRLRRMQAGLTQRELGDRTGIDQAIISKIERDQVPVDLREMERIRALTAALETTTDDLAQALGLAGAPEQAERDDALVFTSMVRDIEQLRLPPHVEEMMKATVEYMRAQAEAARRRVSD